MPDPNPKLRVIDDETDKTSEVPRLRPQGNSFEPDQKPQDNGAREIPARLETRSRELFEGRSVEPGVDAILDQGVIAENIEMRWGADSGRLAGIPYGWFVLITALIIGGGVWSFLAMTRGEKQVDLRYGTVREKVEDDAAKTAEAAKLVEAVEATVRKYLAATTMEELLPLVRHPRRVKALVEEEWKKRPKEARSFVRMMRFQSVVIDGTAFWAIRAEVRDGPPENLLVEQVGETGALVDWETHVFHQPVDWDRYVAERPTDRALDFRVRAVEDMHYSHEFSDSGRWKAFLLTVRNSDDHLFGYAAADSEVARELESSCRKAPNRVATVILRLRIPKGSVSPRGVVIEKIVAPRWLHVEDPAKDAP